MHYGTCGKRAGWLVVDGNGYARSLPMCKRHAEGRARALVQIEEKAKAKT